MPTRLNRLAVAICGAGHSGSTLLGLVLGAHPQCFYAGEAKKSLFLRDTEKPLRKRACKICGPDCRIWSRVRVPPEPDLYEELAKMTARPVIVDSTKDVRWIRERAIELARVGVAQKRIFLTRDGRAVINSRVRKYGVEQASRFVEEWIEQMRATEELLEEAPERALYVRYEELACEPERTIRAICAFLGLDFDPSMLRYEDAEHHPLGGNTGTQSLLAQPSAKIPERSRGYYESLRGFRLDLRWHEELDASTLALFEERAAAVNEKFRWEQRR